MKVKLNIDFGYLILIKLKISVFNKIWNNYKEVNVVCCCSC